MAVKRVFPQEAGAKRLRDIHQKRSGVREGLGTNCIRTSRALQRLVPSSIQAFGVVKDV